MIYRGSLCSPSHCIVSLYISFSTLEFLKESELNKNYNIKQKVYPWLPLH